MNILSFLRDRKTASTEELREAISAAEQQQAQATVAADEITKRRAELLVGGTEDEVEAVETELDRAFKIADRFEIQIAELKRRLAEAEVAARQAELDVIYADAMEAQRKGQALLTNYQGLAQKIASVAAELHQIDRTILVSNEKLALVQDGRHISTPTQALSGRADGSFRSLSLVLKDLCLPDPTDTFGRIWPASATAKAE